MKLNLASGYLLVCILVLTGGEEVEYPADLPTAFPFSTVDSVSPLGVALFCNPGSSWRDSQEMFGESIVNLGDVNNDGLDDVLIHSPMFDNRGRAQVIYGSDQDFPCQLIRTSIDSEIGFAIEYPVTNTDNEFGKGAAGGDYNGDGINDILLASPKYNNDQGLVVIIWGTHAARGNYVNALTMDNTTGIRIYGRSDRYPSKFGSGVGAVNLGDFNGDGIDDFMCQAPNYQKSGYVGAIYVIFGHTGAWEDFVVSSEESLIILGGGGNMYLTIGEVATADFNGDNRPDIAVTSKEGAGAGVVYVLYWTPELNTTGIYSLNGFAGSATTGIKISGTSTTQKIGQASLAFCDVNGDGLQDLLIASPDMKYCCNYDEEGDVTVLLGSVEPYSSFSLSRDTDLSNMGFRIYGAVRDTRVGEYLGCLGDIDGDGYEDFFTNTITDGDPIVIYGHASPFTDSSIATDDLETNGYRYKEYTGVYKAANVGSFLGSDNVTLAFTNPDKLSGSHSGAVYFYSGFTNAAAFPTVAPTQSPTAPTTSPTQYPSASPTVAPSDSPTTSPTAYPSVSPTTQSPSNSPTMVPTLSPSESPTESPSDAPTSSPTVSPSVSPTLIPTESPSVSPTVSPTLVPTESPSVSPTESPTLDPTESPSVSPTESPTLNPTVYPTDSPSMSPSSVPTQTPYVIAGNGGANSEAGEDDSHVFLSIHEDRLAAAAGLGGGALVAAVGMGLYFYFVMKTHARQHRRSNE